ncbi:hypothetical protein SCUCBS95973_007427 [Sporothrix curviconia]|uniref:ubiquitinyl hydrolase 1 n=1 Tax=Sporothrix curviconia TaxID=1260050 RepID=A0ABP0CD79_9PEZI
MKLTKRAHPSTHFLAYPSEMPNMSYRLATPIKSHMIHFGLRGNEVIIVSLRRSDEVFEFVPSRVFVGQNNTYDLPRALVDGCSHWLDKQLGQLEIRRSGAWWKNQDGGWTLNVKSRQAHRKGQVLVDPRSTTAALVSQIFSGFEDTQRLTIFQPMHVHDTLSVELRHLELSFFVNSQGALQCHELNSVVDSNQDAGTLYGYQSMIVLHDVADPKRRSLIAPLGEIEWKRMGVHISVRAKIGTRMPRAGVHGASPETERTYARFEIDTMNLLAPTRSFYPPNLKVLQKTTWDEKMPFGMQSDRYSRVLHSLVEKADQLRRFEDAPGAEKKSTVEAYQSWASHTASLLQTRAFAPNADMNTIRLLAAYCYLPELRSIQMPKCTSYSDFDFNEELTLGMLNSIIATDFVEYAPGYINATGRDAINAWPESKSPDDGGFSSSYINVPAAREKIKHKVPALLGGLSLRPGVTDALLAPDVKLLHQQRSIQQKPDKYMQPVEISELGSIIASFAKSTELLRRSYGHDLAASLTALATTSESQFKTGGRTPAIPLALNALSVAVLDSETTLHTALLQMKACFAEPAPNGYGHGWLQAVGLWPRLTPVSILEILQSKEDIKLEQRMLHMLLNYGELLTFHQRLLRLFRAVAKNDERRVQEELTNSGHQNWNTADYPDWLLMEIDSNMLIREDQVTVAKAMISPESGENSVYQLNMGKGKTSMIVPMVMCVLADGRQLARLGVPKALLLPTAQVLQSRLGGLVGREVRQVPFSRRLLTEGDCRGTFSLFRNHHEDLTRSRGILIAAPEHILAFKLSSEQCYVDGHDMQLAVEMMQFQGHLRSTLCRDVLDESDFTLAVRTQLVYPSGTFTAVDGTPYRWEIIQAVLSLIEAHVATLAESNSYGINVVKRPGGGFPLVHILHSSVEDEIRQRIVQDIVQGRLPFFRPYPAKTVSKRVTSSAGSASISKVQGLLKLALSASDSDDAIDAVAKLFADPEAVANGLLLMRGLLQHDILLTCLKKRWNVQYGLHPSRWPIAVPYEARGVPSERSEFGHPDVTIIFTCLAFYYAGVNLDQFRQGLDHVLHHVDDPATEYEKWSAGDGEVALPEDLQHWNSINIDDEGQVEKLWKCLRFARSVVNHFLNTFVFPLYCRQFSVKLQASAWDLPIFNQPRGEGGLSARSARTTGFSGTNDNKSMLPLTVKQHDLPGLQQTNAEVLTYLLQPRNRGYICTGGHGAARWSEKQLVTSLVKTGVQVFVDAGAYILEIMNEHLARAWLALTEPRIKAAIYFSEADNRAWVVFRDATAAKVPLVSTPFAERLDECIVYYDEAHTRGVDLQLPANARGALTLALGQTKDHTVQEVDQSIRDLCGLENSVAKDFVNSSHVVRWLLEQTCLANEQLGSLYASHGTDFCRRTDAMWKYQDTLDNTQSRKSLLSVLEQPERQTLKIMYGHPDHAVMADAGLGKKRKNKGKVGKVGEVAKESLEESLEEPCLETFIHRLRGYHTAGTGSGGGGMATKGTGTGTGTFEEVEQEREVEVQVEQQRNTRPRTKYTALTFPGHVASAIRRFVDTGVLDGGSGYETFFSFIASTAIGGRHGVKDIATRLYVSSEFRRTIEPPGFSNSPRDDFLRPVEWLVWCPSMETGIVVIPEELELLIPAIRTSTKVHLVAYAAPVTRGMLDFSSLKFYSFPRLPEDYIFPVWLPVEMGILAGRLYMEFDEATDMSQYLLGQGVAKVKTFVDDDDVDDDDDETAEAKKTKAAAEPEPFCASPATFLLEWLPLRRTAQDVLHTPAACVCQERPLRPDHAFFSQSAKYGQPKKEET